MATKDEWFVFLVLLAGLVSDVAGLFISKTSEVRIANETFFVICRDEGGQPVDWKGPKGVLGPKTRPTVQRASYGTSLIFNTVSADESGIYVCSSGTDKREFHLSVKAPLKFTDTSVNQVGEEGKPFTLRCEVKGGKVTWLVEGGDITDKEKFAVLGDGLLIKKVQRSDSKTYICKGVQQSTGMVLDRKINFRVLHKPVFPNPKFVKEEMVWGYINGTVNLTCLVVADPPAEFKWSRQKDKVKHGKVISMAPDISILHLPVTKSAFGEYKCIAKNGYGTLEKRFLLTEASRPLPPNAVEMMKIGSEVINLRIEGPDVDAADTKTTGFKVHFRLVDGEWQERELNVTQDNQYDLDQLKPNSDYEVRVATRNAAGLSEFADPLRFHTAPSSANVAHIGPLVLSSLLYCLLREFW